MFGLKIHSLSMVLFEGGAEFSYPPFWYCACREFKVFVAPSPSLQQENSENSMERTKRTFERYLKVNEFNWDLHG